jgi:plasmid stabilization system protein ParE
MVQVTWSPDALATLELVRAYVDQFNPAAADRLTRRLQQACDSLSGFPNRGRRTGRGTHELPSVPPYIIEYDVGETGVSILAIRHGRQRPPD